MNIAVTIDETRRRDDGLARIVIDGLQIKGVELDLPFKEIHRSFGKPESLALDLLVTAGACYVIDKSVDRRKTSDSWTRELAVSIPVNDPKRWSKASTHLDEALTFLSGDVWETSFRELGTKLFLAPRRRRRRMIVPSPNEPKELHAASLFSGGLDSLIGVIDFLSEYPQSNLLLVGHYDTPGPRSQQRALWQGLQSAFPRRTKLIQVRVSQKPARNVESSLRSRSIVFLALGLYAASEIGAYAPLLTPENGLIALNLPLTASRIGSCSTRTMHPLYLTTLRTMLHDLGVTNPILNPLELKTKADCVLSCRHQTLLRDLAPRTVSCSHGTRRQHWKRRNVANCGYCIPCLFRRVSLHSANIDRGTDYGIDVCGDELTSDSDLSSGDDIRALLNSLKAFKTSAAIRKAILSIARIEPLEEYVALVERGLKQVQSWISAKGSAALRKEAGLK